MSSVGPCYQDQAERSQQKESCAFGHERKHYRTMEPILGFDSTVEVTSYQHNYRVPNSGLGKSENVLEKLNEITCVASNWFNNVCPKQTSRHLAKDSEATIPTFVRDFFNNNCGITADKRKMDYTSGCGNIGSESLSTVREWGSPYQTKNITRHYCSKRGHMDQKQIPLYPSNMFKNGFLSSFVRSHFPPTNVHHRMDKSKESQNHTTHFCKHQCVMQDIQLEKLAEEAKLKPYNTKLRLKALMGQKCLHCQKNMEGQTDDHAVTKEELDVSSEKRVDRSTGNRKASSQRTSDDQIRISMETSDNTVTRKDVHDVFWKHIGIDKQIVGDGMNLKQTCSSPVNKSMETSDIMMSEAKEDGIVNKIEKDSPIDWFEYSCAQGGIMPISDNVIQPSLPVKISKPIDTHVVTCDSDSQTIKSCEKRNEKGESKLAIPCSWSCVEELPNFAKTPEVAFENNSLITSKSDCKIQNSVSGDSSSNEIEDKEGVSADNSKKTSDNDISCVLYIRKCSASKKTRPSSKKRRRQKAKLQQVPQNCRDNPAKEETLSGSKSLAFMLGMDSSPINSHFTHSFIMSFDDGDSDWSDSDDFDCSPEETGKDELCELQNSFGLMNLRVSCMNGSEKKSKSHSESSPEECSKRDLDAINMSWKINIPLNDRPTKQELNRRKVHFANDKNLVTLHPMIAWSYAYATARKGPWEEYARDRNRFQRRIQETECILAPILKHDHRSTIYKNYFEAE
ncbi:hypothetical protein CHS0354_016299 [Potamilus streckersoni]|uniref:Protein DP71L n=1 Tax=Potamilus streckersoni TaxID=2493646 RepID=A0AAE0RME5_9BIVA|nr:hypothetical protein CHS0354_016299 [Potamilus streckersoni]